MRRLKCLSALAGTFAGLLTVGTADAAMIARFDYSNDPKVQPTIVNPIAGVSISNIDIGNSFGTVANPVLDNAASSTEYAGASGGAYQVNLFQTGAFNAATSGYLTFDAVNNSGSAITLDDFDFGVRREAKGPQSYSFRTGPGFATELATGSVGGAGNWFFKNNTFSPFSIANGQTASFRLYGFDGDPARGGAEFGRFDDLTATFSPAAVVAVPEPGSVALLGLGAAGVAWRSRRRSLKTTPATA